MIGRRKTTAPVSSVGADGAQPNVKESIEIVANWQEQINRQAAEKLSVEQKSEDRTAGCKRFLWPNCMIRRIRCERRL